MACLKVSFVSVYVAALINGIAVTMRTSGTAPRNNHQAISKEIVDSFEVAVQIDMDTIGPLQIVEIKKWLFFTIRLSC